MWSNLENQKGIKIDEATEAIHNAHCTLIKNILTSLIQTKNLIRLVEASVMSSLGGVGRAALDCSVMEEDWQRGQSYTAHWHSLNIEPHLHRLVTVSHAST